MSGKKGQNSGPRPHIWFSGPDPVMHKYYKIWNQQRNQARFRNEEWVLEFLEWVELWGDKIEKRGRTKGCYSMMRVDWSQAWSKDNIVIVTRSEHGKLQAQQTQEKRARNKHENN